MKCVRSGTDLEAYVDSTDTGLLGHMRQIHGAQEHNAESIAQLHQLDGVPAWCAAPCVPGEPPSSTCLEEIDPQEISSRETSSKTNVKQEEAAPAAHSASRIAVYLNGQCERSRSIRAALHCYESAREPRQCQYPRCAVSRCATA